MNRFSLLLLIALHLPLSPAKRLAQEDPSQGLTAVATADFELDGRGSADAWLQTKWIELPKRNDIGHALTTRCKLLYSETGMYVLFDCKDAAITSTVDEDFGELYREDVVEVFIWPDEGSSIYFEYELSPRNHELVLLVPNFNGAFHGWRPWKYTGERKTRHQTAIHREGGVVTGWTAECFIPYALLMPLQNVPPRPGSHWRVNFYRADFDSGQRAIWAWKPFEQRFHEYQKFGYIFFEE